MPLIPEEPPAKSRLIAPGAEPAPPEKPRFILPPGTARESTDLRVGNMIRDFIAQLDELLMTCPPCTRRSA